MELVEVDTADVRLRCLVAGSSGPWILAQHGFPDAAETFLPIVPALVASGARVVMPTLRGYAPSGVARSGRHDAVAAGADLVELARHFGGGERVRLLGHDWGAYAAFAAAALAPERFERLVSMAVPHPGVHHNFGRPAQLRRSWYIGMFQLPWIAEARLGADDLALVDRLWRDWSPRYAVGAEELAGVKAAIRGRIGPVLDYYRRIPRLPRVGAISVPALHLHGAEDGCVGVECCEGAEAFHTGGYALEVIEGAGHFLHKERPEEVARRILAHYAG